MYVEMKHIEKNYGSFHASRDVSFGIAKGKLVALLGPSGSGKTTILRMLAGLENPNSGDIFIDGRRVNDIPAAKRGIGFVFQNYALFRYMTVFDNVAFGLKIQKRPKEEIRKRVLEMIDLVGLSGMEKRYPNQLSGGQRQRVAFARALAPNPQVLLLDEPFAAIDAKVRKELRNWLKDTIHRVGITSIFVTHDQDEAVEVADEIIITNHGHIEQVGTPLDIYRQPQTPFVAQFIGTSVVINNCNVLTGFLNIGKSKQAIVRPEFLKIYKHGTMRQYISAAEEGTVEAIVFRGSHLDVTVRIKGLAVHGEYAFDDPPLSVGETVQVLIYRLYVLDGDKTYLKENNAMTSELPPWKNRKSLSRKKTRIPMSRSTATTAGSGGEDSSAPTAGRCRIRSAAMMNGSTWRRDACASSPSSTLTNGRRCARSSKTCATIKSLTPTITYISAGSTCSTNKTGSKSKRAGSTTISWTATSSTKKSTACACAWASGMTIWVA